VEKAWKRAHALKRITTSFVSKIGDWCAGVETFDVTAHANARPSSSSSSEELPIYCHKFESLIDGAIARSEK
jgi:hypothetical protein